MSCPIDPTTWMTTAASELQGLRNPDGGWPFVAGDASATEPTVLAMLALSGTPGIDLATPLAWLIGRRRDDAFFTASPAHADRSWLTPLAAMACRLAGNEAVATAAAGALLAEPTFTFSSVLTRGLYGYDTSIPGWPWTSGDFSFVEPTALAMTFLKQTGHSAESRVRQAVSMLHTRALAAGGWNYGEPQVLGGDLFPTVAPTALALIALADEQDGTTDAAVQWLQSRQGQVSSLFSLGWGAAALNVLGVLDDAWRQDVMTQWCAAPPERRGPRETALCMLGLWTGTAHPLSVS
jgi:hypothetical protein